MKIRDIIYKTPEMTEEKLLEIIKAQLPLIRSSVKRRISELHPDITLEQTFLDEYDLISEKQSKLTRSQRDQVVGFVGLCMIRMTKGDE